MKVRPTNAAPGRRRDHRRGRCGLAIVLAAIVLMAVTLAVRSLAAPPLDPPIWDEPVMLPVVTAIEEQGWTTATLIDYEDTKGPVFFALYAASVAGGADYDDPTDLLRDLRRTSRILFVAGGIVLVGLIVTRAAPPGREIAWGLAGAAAWMLLPYNLLLGQLFMSEPSFSVGVLLLVLAFLGTSPAAGTSASGGARPRRTAWRGPVVAGVVLALLLHHRIHAVVWAGAIVLVATWREGPGAWRWWFAFALAGLARVPLMLRWDGLVTEAYQDRYGFGFRLESLTYLAAALAPYTAVLLVARWLDPERRRAGGHGGGLLVLGAGLAGGLLAVIAPPRLDLTYLGMTATALRALPGPALVESAVLGLLAALGLAGLAAGFVNAARSGISARRRRLEVLALLPLVLGWGLYALTRGDVYDRYLLAFSLLLPIVWLDVRPRALVAVQGLGLLMLLVLGFEAWSGG